MRFLASSRRALARLAAALRRKALPALLKGKCCLCALQLPTLR